MAYVKKCEEGYQRVDCGICARICPEGTEIDGKGTLCKKPEVQKKNLYESLDECKIKERSCVQLQRYATSDCPENFKPLGKFLCAYECPEEFENTSEYCMPDIITNTEYYLSSFASSPQEAEVDEY